MEQFTSLVICANGISHKLAEDCEGYKETLNEIEIVLLGNYLLSKTLPKRGHLRDSEQPEAFKLITFH